MDIANTSYVDDGGGVVFTASDTSYYVRVRIPVGFASDYDIVFWPSIIDLTKWVGYNASLAIDYPYEAYVFGIPETFVPFDSGTLVQSSVNRIEFTSGDTTK